MAKAKSNSKKEDWYQTGRSEALEYLRSMRDEPEGDHIFGYLAALLEQGSDALTQSKYIEGFAEVIQSALEDLIDRAALFDGIVKAARVAASDSQNKGVAHV